MLKYYSNTHYGIFNVGWFIILGALMIFLFIAIPYFKKYKAYDNLKHFLLADAKHRVQVYIFWPVTILMFIILILVSIMKIDLRVNDDEVTYRVFPLQWKSNSIRRNDIDTMFIRKYSPMSEFGGWGIRTNGKCKAYTVKGNKGMQIILKNGNQILVGIGE